MSLDSCLGILLRDDGPDDYEWYGLDRRDTFGFLDQPRVVVGKVPSDGDHEPAALMSLGAAERLSPVAMGLVRQSGARARVWACTSASFISGLEWARQQVGELTRELGMVDSSFSKGQVSTETGQLHFSG